MTAGVFGAAVLAAVLGLALGGPYLLRSAAPMLVRAPRVATAVILSAVAVWLGALLAIGPVLAWTATGPALIPAGAAAVCRRCLDAATPFAIGAFQTPVPAALLLALPVAASAVLLVAFLAALRARQEVTRGSARRMRDQARRRRVAGRDVHVIDDEHPFAIAFSSSLGGIVLSTSALDALGARELAAVLAHEEAHVRQRHHLIVSLSGSLRAVLGWVPLVSAAADAIPHYLEIAADNRARASVGTSALVSALLKLGEAPRQSGGVEFAGALHATGPQRIPQLVRPSRGLAGAAAAGMVAMVLAAVAALGATGHLAYLAAALTGCF